MKKPCDQCEGSTIVNGILGIGKAILGVDATPPGERRWRRQICNTCPEARKGRRSLWAIVCTVCHCFIRFKVSIASQSCPRGHWKAVKLTVGASDAR